MVSERKIEIVFENNTIGYGDITNLINEIKNKEISLKRAYLKIGLGVPPNYSKVNNSLYYCIEQDGVVISTTFIKDLYIKEIGDIWAIDVLTVLNNLALYEGNFYLKLVKDSNVFMGDDITIIYECDSGEYVPNKSYKDIGIGKAGIAKIDLNTGNMIINRDDISTKGNRCPISVSQNYNKRRVGKANDLVVLETKKVEIPSYNCGKGWKLNLEQYLVADKKSKVDENGVSSATYVWIDENGENHTFREKYYVNLGGNNKAYYDADEVSIDIEGNLYKEIVNTKYDVVRECTDSYGNMLYLKLEEYKGLEFISTENEEIEKIKKSIVSYEQELENTIKALDHNYYMFGVLKNTNDIYNETNFMYLNDEFASFDISSILDDDKVDLIPETDYVVYGEQINSFNASLNSYKLERKRLITNKKNYTLELEKLKKQLKAMNKYNPVHYIRKSDGAIYGFGLMEDREDVYRLVMVGYQDYSAQVIYDDYGKIVSVIDCDDKQLVIEYDDNKRVSKVSNSFDDIIHYEYSYDNNLTKVSNRKDCVEYVWDENELSKVFVKENKGIRYEYDQDGRVIAYEDFVIIDGVEETKNRYELEYISNGTTSISKVKSDEVDTYQFDRLGRLETVYKNKVSDDGNTIVEAKSFEYSKYNKNYSVEVYPYAENKLFGSYFEGTELVTTGVYTLGDTIIDNSLSLDTMEASVDGVDRRVFTTSNQLVMNVKPEVVEQIRNGNAYDFILSGWARANSNRIYKSRSTSYGNDISFIDNEIDKLEEQAHADNNSKFELRLIVNYLVDGVASSETYYVSYNWENKGWQYVALPIGIHEDKLNSISSMKVMFVYSNNNGTAEFYGAELREGNWDYKEYDNNNMVIYSENSLTDSVETYDYNDSFELMKSTKTYKDGEVIDTLYYYDDYGRVLKVEDSKGNVKQNIYDEKGLLLKSESYNKKLGNSKICEEHKYNDQGEELETFNEFGDLISSEVYEQGRVVSSKNNKGQVISYTYDDNELISIATSLDGESNYNVIEYEDGLVKKQIHNNTIIEYTYDKWDRVESISIGGNLYATYNYSEKMDQKLDVEVIEYANREGVEIERYFDGRIYATYMIDKDGNRSQLNTTIYNTNKDLNSISDILNATTTGYEYYKDGNIAKKSITKFEENSIVIDNVYDALNRLSSIKYTYQNMKSNNKLVKYKYSDDNESLLETCDVFNLVLDTETNNQNEILNQSTTIKYDALNRKKKVIDYVNGTDYTHSYEYVTICDRTSNLIASETYSSNGKVTSKYNYIYDEYGNIVKVKEDGKLIYRYTYDGLNRLVREDNKLLDSTIVYTYDIGGNIIRKEKYTYTLEDTLGDGESLVYRYSDKGWNDQLVEYGEYSVEYDDLGRPKSHKGNTLQWSNVRQLTQYGDNIRYTYDMNGIRIGKSILKDGEWVPSVKYYVDGDRILAQNDGDYMEFIYGVSGVEGFVFTYKDKNEIEVTGKYRYRKNILGDIIGIIDEANDEIVRYVYDAYGNHKVYVLSEYGYIEYDESMDYNDDRYDVERYHAISKENPFRYRGYYYDVETQLFYCNSRYYSPELCRWISPDSIEYLDPQSINGLNLYCYCMNNPIMYADPDGHAPKWWQWLISGLEVVAGIALCFVPGAQGLGVTLIGTGVGSMINGYINESNGGTFDAGWWGGQVSGLISAIPGVGVPLGAFVGSVTTDWIDRGWKGIDWNKALVTGVIAWGVSIFPTMIGEVASKFHIYDKALYFVNAYNTIITSTANSIVNVYWRGKNNDKKRYEI